MEGHYLIQSHDRQSATRTNKFGQSFVIVSLKFANRQPTHDQNRWQI